MKRLMLVLCMIIALVGCSNQDKQDKKSYGVFLNANHSDLKNLKGYDYLVIDGQNFSKADIKKLHKDNNKVISYLNVGSIETFRSYYKNYQDITLSVYEGWEDERWVDVSKEKWKTFIINKAKQLKAKGIDGYFIDNCDVLYHYNNKKIFNGLVSILRDLKKTLDIVIINGGDCFVDQYYDKYHKVNDVLSGINQETVFSAIDFDHNRKLKVQDKKNSLYYQSYIEKYAKVGVNIYLLEYTKDQKIKDKIVKYADKHKFKYYISKSVNLEIK